MYKNFFRKILKGQRCFDYAQSPVAYWCFSQHLFAMKKLLEVVAM
jgi:hypothetical protein